MAEPTNIDTSLYRMKAYATLLKEDPEKTELAGDLKTLIDWIAYARPLLGAVSDISATSFGQVQRRHGFMTLPPEPKPQPSEESPPEPTDGTVDDPPPPPPPTEEPKPAP